MIHFFPKDTHSSCQEGLIHPESFSLLMLLLPLMKIQEHGHLPTSLWKKRRLQGNVLLYVFPYDWNAYGNGIGFCIAWITNYTNTIIKDFIFNMQISHSWHLNIWPMYRFMMSNKVTFLSCLIITLWTWKLLANM